VLVIRAVGWGWLLLAVACGGRSLRSDGGATGEGGASAAAGAAGALGSAGLGGASGGAAGSAGAAGGAGLAGSAGVAGMEACGPLIDDMEDGTGRLCAGAGRVGAWYAYNDGLGVQWPPPGEPGTPILPVELDARRGQSTRAMYSFHSYGDVSQVDGTKGWGAGIGLDLWFDGRTYAAYDASAYTGVSFFARSGRSYTEVQLRVNSVDTTLDAYGGTCPKEFCNTYAKPFYVTDEWVEYRVAFADLHPYLAEPLAPTVLRTDRLTNLQFLFVRFAPGVSTDADVWIDDVRFF